MRHTRGYAAALATMTIGVVGATVAACTTTPPPTVMPATTGTSPAPSPATATAPSTATTSATTLAYPTDVPAEARANTPEGAKAFAKYFFAQLNKAYTTPQAGLIAPLSTDSCKSCADYEQKAFGYVREHRRYDRAAIEVLEVSLTPGETPPPGIVWLDVTAHQLPARIIDSSGATTFTVTERTGIFFVALAFRDGWLVDSVKVYS